MMESNGKHKIKVVIAANDLAMAGAQRLVIDQLHLLDKNIFDLSLIVLMQFPDKGDFYDLVPSDVKVFRLHFKDLWDIIEWFRVVKILKQIRPDIVKSSLFFSNTIFRILKPFFAYKIIT